MEFNRVSGKGKEQAKFSVSGNFVNLQLNSPQSPFLTYLTVLVPSFAFNSVTVADDMRDLQKRERSKLIGVAVMLPAPTYPYIPPYEERIVGKCWLVPVSKQEQDN